MQPISMRYNFFLHYGWFFQNLGKEAVRTFMHTTVNIVYFWLLRVEIRELSICPTLAQHMCCIWWMNSTCFAFYFNHLLYLSYCRFRAKFVVTYKSMFVQFSTPWTFLRIYLLQKLSNCKECLKETEKKILNKSLTPDLTFALTPKNVKVNNVKWPANFSYGLLPLFNLCLPYTRHYNPLLIINRGFQAQISLFST